jgi:hypothetical protein
MGKGETAAPIDKFVASDWFKSSTEQRANLKMVNDAGKSLNEIRRDSWRAVLAHHNCVDEQTVSAS